MQRNEQKNTTAEKGFEQIAILNGCLMFYALYLLKLFSLCLERWLLLEPTENVYLYSDHACYSTLFRGENKNFG